MIAWTIYVTFAGAVALLFLPRVLSRWIALATTIAGFAISLATFFCDDVDLAHFATIVRVPWVPMLGMNYHLAVDGVSLTMALVTGIAAVSTVLFSWDVAHRQNEFFFWLLLPWAPTGHVAAPTAGSMLLAGIVMKLGAYGGLRVAMNLFPQGFQMWSKWIAVLAVIGIVYAAAVALRQSDLKFVIGYSSVSPMGLVP